MSEPFSQIAMLIVGLLPWNSNGHKYILVILTMQLATWRPLLLRICDTKAMAEELRKIFSQVGTPKKILTDQGTTLHITVVGGALSYAE